MIDQALACLATTIFMESATEPAQTQISVGYVLMRRADFNPKNVCREMAKPFQFSWYGKVNPPSQIKSYYYQLASRIIHKQEFDYSYGATNFHDVSISKPKSWSKLTPVVKWSHMIFYKRYESQYASF
jgi:spore germination cell wall hydrolase CwlJ-like protein